MKLKNRPLVYAVAAWIVLCAVGRAQVVAETVGFTIRDRQMYGPAVRYICFDSLSGTHAVWKDSYGLVRYNFRPRTGGWRWPDGIVVNAEPRTLGSMDVNMVRHTAMIAASHLDSNVHVLTRLVDSAPGAGTFSEDEVRVDCHYPLIGANQYGTPKFAALSNDSLTFLSMLSVVPFFLGHVGTFPAFNLAGSKQIGRYGYIWAETEDPDRGTLFLCETPNNGQNWYAPSRLSDSVPSPLSRSLLSGCGTYDSTNIHLLADLYDGSDVLHSQIWHYTKYPTPTWRLVHEYACPPGARIGDDALAADRPSIGMNRALDELCAVWEQFNPDNVDPLTGLCRADIWAARTDIAATRTNAGDYNWGPPVRLTVPDSTSKRFPFLSEVVNDTLHIIYFADRVAGFSELGQGPQTVNPVIYLRVPVNLLPSGVSENRPMTVRRLGLGAYPNPFRGTVTIRLSDSSFIAHHSSLVLRVFDAAGGAVLESPIANRHSPFALDLRSMPAGVYFVTAGAGPDVRSCRIVKTP